MPKYENVSLEIRELQKLGMDIPSRVFSVAAVQCQDPSNDHMSDSEMVDMCIDLAMLT